MPIPSFLNAFLNSIRLKTDFYSISTLLNTFSVSSIAALRLFLILLITLGSHFFSFLSKTAGWVLLDRDEGTNLRNMVNKG